MTLHRGDLDAATPGHSRRQSPAGQGGASRGPQPPTPPSETPGLQDHEVTCACWSHTVPQGSPRSSFFVLLLDASLSHSVLGVLASGLHSLPGPVAGFHWDPVHRGGISQIIDVAPSRVAPKITFLGKTGIRVSESHKMLSCEGTMTLKM